MICSTGGSNNLPGLHHVQVVPSVVGQMNLRMVQFKKRSVQATFYELKKSVKFLLCSKSTFPFRKRQTT